MVSEVGSDEPLTAAADIVTMTGLAFRGIARRARNISATPPEWIFAERLVFADADKPRLRNMRNDDRRLAFEGRSRKGRVLLALGVSQRLVHVDLLKQLGVMIVGLRLFGA